MVYKLFFDLFAVCRALICFGNAKHL